MLMGIFQLTTSTHFPLGPISYLEHGASLSLSALFIGFCDPGEKGKEQDRLNEKWGM